MSRQSAGTRDLRAMIDELYSFYAALRSGQGGAAASFGKALATAQGPVGVTNVPTADGASAVMVTTAPAVSVPASATLEIQGYVVLTNTVGATRSARVSVEAQGSPGVPLGSSSNSSLTANLPFLAVPFLALVSGAALSPNGLYTINVFCTTGGASSGDLTVQTNNVVATVKRVA